MVSVQLRKKFKGTSFCGGGDSFKKLKVDQAVIPGGCTGFIQAPDFCWNKPFKDSYTKSYDDWFENEKEEFTAASNDKAAPLEVLVGWIVKAWDSISNDIIVNSFKVCGLTNNLDRSEDEQIIIFKVRNAAQVA